MHCNTLLEFQTTLFSRLQCIRSKGSRGKVRLGPRAAPLGEVHPGGSLGGAPAPLRLRECGRGPAPRAGAAPGRGHVLPRLVQVRGACWAPLDLDRHRRREEQFEQWVDALWSPKIMVSDAYSSNSLALGPHSCQSTVSPLSGSLRRRRAGARRRCSNSSWSTRAAASASAPRATAPP